MENTLKQSPSVIESGQQSPTYVSETRAGFAPFMEDKVLADQDTKIGDSTWIRYGSELRNAVVSRHVFIGFRTKIIHAIIQEFAMLASGAILSGTKEHPITLGRGSWIGARAVIRAGVHVGDRAIVAAGAVVSQDVAPDTITAGRPARPIRERLPAKDGWPSPDTTVKYIRQRTPHHPPFSATASDVWMSALKNNFPDTAKWEISEDAILDAQFEGGPGVHIGSGVIAMGRNRKHGGITDDGGIHIGADSVIGANCILEGSGGIHIGNSVRMGSAVYVLSSRHDTEKTSLPWRATPIMIGDRASIGAGATLVGPLKIGADTQIAPGALVVNDVNENAYTGGIFETLKGQ